MIIESIVRNPEYASWTVMFTEDGTKHTIVVKLNSSNAMLESLTNSTIPNYAVDLIKDELADRGEIRKSFCDESECLVPQNCWAR